MKLLKLRLLSLAALLCALYVACVYGPVPGLAVLFFQATAIAQLSRGNSQVLGVNTFDASLVVDVARMSGITVLQSKLAALRAFSRDFSADILAPKKTVQVAKVTSTSAVQTNPTNFETGDTDMDNIAVTVAELSKSFHITNDQMQKGFRLQQLFDINLRTLANGIIDAATAPLTAANYGAALVNADAEDFGTDDLKVLFAAAKNYEVKNLVLDGSYLAQFLPTDKFQFMLGEQGAYGFDGMYMNNRWDGAETSVQGFVCDPSALAVASGLPQLDPSISKLMLVDEVIQIPDLGISIKFNVWGATAGRVVWGSFGVMFGAAAGDTTAAELIKLVP